MESSQLNMWYCTCLGFLDEDTSILIATLMHDVHDILLVQLYRILWIYIAVHGFASTQQKNGRPRWPSEWRQAAILIAQGPTPLLVAGGEMDVHQVEAGEILIRRYFQWDTYKKIFPTRKWSLEVWDCILRGGIIGFEKKWKIFFI